jgi:PAS domain S-box-containing protein
MTSLRFRIIISTLAIIFLIITGSYLVIQDTQTSILEKDFRDKGYLLSNHLALEIVNPLLINDLTEVRKSVDDLKNSYLDIDYVFITDSRGIVLVHTFEGGFPKALQNMTNPSNSMKEIVFETDRGIIHEFDAPVSKNAGYVHVGVSENRVRAQIQETSRKLLLLGVAAMVMGGFFTFYIGRRLTDPVVTLKEGANRINKGVLDQKIDISTGDELGGLATTLNDMAQNLNQKIGDLVASKEQTETAQKYLETLFDSIDDGIFVINPDHEIVKMNKSSLKMMDLSEEQVRGKKCHELVFGNTKPKGEKDECPIDTLLRTRNPVRFAHEMEIKGNKKILEINASPLLNKNDITDIILVLRDVTQQKKLEEEIISRNRKLTVLNDLSRNINYTFDIDKLLLNSLDNLLNLTGMESGCAYLRNEKSGEYSLKVHIGNEERCSVNLDSREFTIKDKEYIPEIKTDASGKNIYIPLKSKDTVLGIIALSGKEPQHFLNRDVELFSAIGNQIGVVIENILFYNNIKYLNEFNEEILNNVNLAIHVVDKDMKILAVNNELLKLGRGRIRKEEILNRNLFEAFPFLKEKQTDKEYEYVMKTGEIFMSEEKTEYYNDVIYTSTSKIPIKDKKGTVEKIITVIKDVSNQKRLEEELRDSYEELRLTYSKLKELFQIKDNFLSNISHELKTPLTSIMGYTELILEENITREQRNKLEIIFRNSTRLSNLINMLLDTTIIESRNLDLDLKLFSIRDLALEVAEDMKSMAAVKNIPVHVDVPPLMIKGDRDRLAQVLYNLMDNAIKFTIKGEIRLSATEENENIHIKISDTGIGIPEDKLELIFDRFYQSELSHERRFGGTGLGLWISKNMVEAHGGKIWAESKNIGSTFHILLPGLKANEQQGIG